MRRNYGLSSEDVLKAKATMIAAKHLGFIEEDSFAAMEQRCLSFNEENQKRKANGNIVYGVLNYSFSAYLQYELTLFKLDFLSGKAKDYSYQKITEEAKRDFFEKNQDLFTDYEYKNYEYDDVKEVVEKRIREEEYYEYIEDILCQLQEGG